ncbi:MAG: phenylacetic acid degradation protein [Bradyrhizobiaceae bacterium]|nr:MAG: phenylacetic acid degradation protein [Bradyrhizobiaceae bacterium]
METAVNEKTRTSGVVPPEVALGFDGLTLLKGMIAGEYPPPPIAETLGFGLVEAEPGRAVFEGSPGFRHYNPIGVVHGGFAMTLLDSALGCAVHTTLKAGEGYTTLEVKVNLVRAITKDTGTVRATGRLIHRGRTTATAEADLRDAKGNLLAHGTTTCMIFPAKK